MYIREYDENHILRVECDYFPFENNRLAKEEIYDPNGKLLSRTIWYGHGQEKNIFIRNDVSGKVEGTEIDSAGRITQSYEDSDTISNSCFSSFYPDGAPFAEGFKTIANVVWVEHLDSVSIGQPVNNPICRHYPSEVKTGYWHYYYPNGKDSAIGNYFPIGYYTDDSIPKISNYGDLVLITLIIGYLYTENKDGVWQYFSSEGKLIYTEEWDKGNLLKRIKY